MEMKFLFPHRYRLIGWILALPSAALAILAFYHDFGFPFLYYTSGPWNPGFQDAYFLFNLTYHNFTGDIALILLMVGLLMVAFSRERVEDERTIRLRLESLLWAFYVNSALVLLAIILCYGTMFLAVMVYNMVSTLVIFIGRYHWVMFSERQHLKSEAV
ncbi:hypothetical protein [Dinghuibacter silviterrae]|uniref:Uncharacterized protein n=1 Tax=Dinghuibacter silviterrae TaxID=1539049 RepID=A0A4R8DFY5_9BACT|nr:hypothetical protein [Dinghuibacter silviterrae]TDW96154.1 hypothetical protein EDB95_3977 [Dinghuibacter silviterrae]